MSRTTKPRRQVYAVVRIDHFHSSDTPLEHKITIKEIVSCLALAKEEVERLNELSHDKNVTYFWQMTRLYPDGQSAGVQVDRLGSDYSSS